MFELHKKGTRIPDDNPMVTISPDGRMYINKAAVDAFRLICCTHVLLYCDIENKAIQMKFLESMEGSAYTLSHTSSGGIQVGVRGFLKMFSLLPARPESYDLKRTGHLIQVIGCGRV